MRQSPTSLQKAKSLVTLIAFGYSLFSPLFNIAFAVAPTVNLSYSANPAGPGTMTVTATYSESIVGTPLISIDQPGTTDIVEAPMLDLGTGSSWSYDYTVNVADGSGYIDGTANVTLTGAYNGSGEIADPASNASFGIVTLDTTPPVVTLSGSTPITILSGSVFNDDGATWTDNMDGTGVISAYNSGTLDVNNSGSYLIGYVYVDAGGNTGSVSRVVNVVEPDLTAPVVTIVGSTPVDTEFGGPFVDAGANWTDNVDGSGNIPAYNSGTLDVNTLGTYHIGYAYVDAAGNTGSADRVVNVVDTTAPVVTLSGSTPVSILSGSVFNDEGATWSDAVDGTGVIASYNSGTVDVNNSGSYTISYVYVDGAGNTGSVNRVVNVMDPDTTSPVVTLNGGSPVDVEYAGVFSDLGATWTDNIDGTGNILMFNSGTLDVNTLGTYHIGYVYVDAAGNTGSVERVVNVVDTTAPVVTLSGSTPVTILSGSVFNDEGATWSDAVDGTGVISNYNSGTLDVNNTGSYTVSYIYVDAAGNTGSVNRVVNVVDPDLTAPIVTLNGGSPVDTEFGGPFVDAGANWTDNVDGTGTIGGYNSGSLDVNTLGTYLIGYIYVDAAGNTGSVNRVVNVVDTTAPVVTLSGSTPVTILSGSVFGDEGATWSDAVDGTGVIASYNSGTVDVNNSGSYTISYVYVDGAGNTGSVNRVVNVVEPDLTAPVVTIVGSTPVDVEFGGPFVDPGATWTDNVDGSGNIPAYNSGTLDVNTLGTYLIGYAYVDAAGNTGSADRVVNVVDTTAPIVTLSGATPVNIFSGGVFTDEGANWTDAVDGSGTIGGYNSGTVDVNNTGSYTVSYVYVDAAGNTGSVDRVINVMDPDTTPPVVTLYGVSPVDTEFGSPYIDAGADWSDNYDGTGNTLVGSFGDTGSFASSGTVDTNTLGTYTLEYLKVDTSGNSGSAVRTVNVVDTTAPVVTLSGATPVTILTGSVFNDEGATWTDLHDGSGVILSATSGSVDTNTIGSYTLVYSYTDTSGNTGTTSRTVNVVSGVDVTPPVVTLVGSGTVSIQIGSGFTDQGATWTDNVDGSGIIANYNSGSINTGALGTYIVGYLYVDGAGNTGSINRTIHVVDTVIPTASVTYSTLSTTSGSVIATLTGASEAITIVNNAGSPNHTFAANGSFTYIYTDVAGNTGTTVATVNNIDTTPPVITIVGGTPLTVTLGSTYIDQGATANDNVSGNVTAFITSTGSVNTSMTGTYTIQYSVADGVGNIATATRTVNVSPTVVSTPSGNPPGGGGGGGSAGYYVTYFSAPINATEVATFGTPGTYNPMALGLEKLQSMLSDPLGNNKSSEIIQPTDGITSGNTETKRLLIPSVDPITNDIMGRQGETEIDFLIRVGIINNVENFYPERTMSRGEFIKVVTGFYNPPTDGNIDLPYTDIESPELRANLEVAYSFGLISPQEKFRPNDPITLGEAKTILLRSEGVSGQTNLFSSDTTHITREKGAIIIVGWMNNSANQ